MLISPTQFSRGASRSPKAIALLIAYATLGCTSFAPVRSAQVVPGPSGTIAASIATPPGDDAAWFWSFDCAVDCNHFIPSLEASYVHGFRPGDHSYAYELGAGINGLLYPFVHVYIQPNHARDRAYGFGARLGAPVYERWHEHQIFFRYEIPRADNESFVLNPTIFLHTGTSPNRENPGTFVAFIPAVGLHSSGHRFSGSYAVLPVLGWTHRESSGRVVASSFTAFVTVAVALTLHGARR